MSAGWPLTRGRIELPLGLCLVAALVGIGATLAVRRSTPVDPGLVVAAGALDFGSAWEQPAYRHGFTVTNPTDRPIRVTEFATGCGCTTVEPRTVTVPPGGTQTLIATLDLTNRVGESGAEFLVELLPSLAHQPPGERTVWTLRGDVRPNPIELSQPSLDFGDAVIAGEPPPSQEIAVALAENAAVEGLRLAPVAETGVAELIPAGPRSWTLSVSPRGGLPIGPFAFAVRLEATGKGTLPPYREIEVTGVVRDDISAWPSSLNFGALTVGETSEEYVVLASHRSRPFEVERIEPPAGVTVVPAEEQLADGSKTFVVQQRAVQRGEQSSEVLFYVRRGESSAANQQRVTIRLGLSYYGTGTAGESSKTAASPESGEAAH